MGKPKTKSLPRARNITKRVCWTDNSFVFALIGRYQFYKAQREFDSAQKTHIPTCHLSINKFQLSDIVILSCYIILFYFELSKTTTRDLIDGISLDETNFNAVCLNWSNKLEEIFAKRKNMYKHVKASQ